MTDEEKTTWTEAAEEIGSEVEFNASPDYVVKMAMVEQQKRTADALERVALAAEWFVYGLHEAPDESMAYWLKNVRQKIQGEKEAENG